MAMPRKKKPTTIPGLGQRLLEARARAGHRTASSLAAAIGVDPVNVSRWERGRNVPSTLHLHKLARALGVTMDFLLRGEAA